ncbi:heterokaryon incompatibility protein-domain-containing protein [Lasiosphaeria hispida]|uniref:Heterokaryon incompatibility protein-domain-containing protein n=1 Tax=Lasiosphaeria hispida TaxID=260671 RepID=A0AAJ0HG73_9PEZI|nr:heterokaryon incompatibility protein-domain-containing protein [Lasiosphaeria hispida]
MPTRLLDIGHQDGDPIRLCSPPPDAQHPYAALSHRWGATQTFTTTTSTLASREKHITFAALPPTFQDAVTVSRSLDLGYLWIDSLCIIQNDAADWARESTKMRAVYSHATLVIAASRARADTAGFLHPRSIRGPITISFPAHSKTHHLSLQQTHATLSPHEAADPLRTEPLHTRAWALQERYLAPRRLSFGTHQLFWECSRLVLAEDGRRNDVSPHRLAHLIPAGHPGGCHLAWHDMVKQYSAHDLTLASDRLPALAGLAQAFAAATGDTYIAGLWRGDLLAGLLWRRSGFEALRRTGTYRAPSWSWAAVEGRVSFRVYSWFNQVEGGREEFAAVRGWEVQSVNGPFSSVTGGSLVLEAPVYPQSII